MTQFHFRAIKVPKGHYKRVDINITRLPSRTLIDMPVFIYRGKQAGPTVLLTAGLHGDEINGIMTMRKLISEKYLIPERGSIIAIPVVNIFGFLQNTRELPGGRDLNRSFPGGVSGSIASQIAHILMSEIVPFIDLGVDFHTGGSRLNNYPQIRCVVDNERDMELARYFDAPFIVHSSLIEKSFRKEVHKMGKPMLVYEGGESLRLDEFSIQEGIEGVKRLLHHLDMKKYDYPFSNHETHILHKTSWTRAKTSGIFDDYIHYGEKVRRGQILAHITDPYGSMRHAVKSPKDGYVIAINNMPVINAGDPLFHIGA